MKRIIPLFLLFLFFAVESFGQAGNPLVGTDAAISFIKEVRYTYTPTGGTETTVRALDVNGVNLIRMTTGANPTRIIPIVILGGDNQGSIQVPGIYLTVLHLGTIENSVKQQMVVKLPETTISGTHTLFVSFDGTNTNGMDFTLGSVNRGINLYTCPACEPTGTFGKGEIQTSSTCNIYDWSTTPVTITVRQCLLIGSPIAPATTP